MTSSYLILCHPLLLLPSIFPASGSFPMSQFFTSGGQIIGLSASASVLPMNIFRTDFLEDGLVGPPCSPRDTQEPYPAPQFKSINSLVCSFPYGPTLTSIHGAAAAAAKSLQSCLTLCDPRDSSPPGSSVPGILQARTLEWVAIAFSNAGK